MDTVKVIGQSLIDTAPWYVWLIVGAVITRKPIMALVRKVANLRG